MYATTFKTISDYLARSTSPFLLSVNIAMKKMGESSLIPMLSQFLNVPHREATTSPIYPVPEIGKRANFTMVHTSWVSTTNNHGQTVFFDTPHCNSMAIEL